MTLLLLAGLLAGSAFAQAKPIGVFETVQGPVEVARPGAKAKRVPRVNDKVYARERITTGEEGRVKLLLADETAFTMGPNSSMVMDEFVYDPETGVGEAVANLVYGFFRFISGKIAKNQPDNMRIKLPSATVQVKGTEVQIHIDKDGKATVQVLSGAVSIRNDRGEVVVEKAGHVSLIEPGQAPLESVPAPPDLAKVFARALKLVDRARRGKGVDRDAPTIRKVVVAELKGASPRSFDAGLDALRAQAELVVIGPALWAELEQADPKLGKRGFPIAFNMRDNPDDLLPGRGFRERDAAELWRKPVWEALRHGVRRADKKEEVFMTAFVPELKGWPVFVSEDGSLLLFRSRSLVWVDRNYARD